MSDMSVENMSFKTGMELKVTGVFHSNPLDFSINVGDSEEAIALHCDLRFNKLECTRWIILDSYKDYKWEDQLKINHFPFYAGQNFEVKIVFNNDTFGIKVPDYDVINFPNRHAKKKYCYMFFKGEATVHGISVKKTEITN